MPGPLTAFICDSAVTGSTGRAMIEGVAPVFPKSWGPIDPGSGATDGAVKTGGGSELLAPFDADTGAALTRRQLNTKQRVIKPMVWGLDIAGFNESVIFSP